MTIIKLKKLVDSIDIDINETSLNRTMNI